MRNYIRTLSLVAFVAALALPFALYADWITLKNGGKVQGEIVRQNSREISIRTETGGFLTFQMRQVTDYHRNGVPSDKKKETNPTTDAKEAGSLVYEDGANAPESPHKDFKVGKTKLPASFKPEQNVPPIAAGEKNLGAYREERTGSSFSVITATIPEHSINFAGYTRLLRKQFLAQENFRILRWQQRTVEDRPALFAEIETKDKESPKVLLLEWISLSEETVCRLNLTVPKHHYRLRTEAYSKIVLDFELTRVKPTASATPPNEQP